MALHERITSHGFSQALFVCHEPLDHALYFGVVCLPISPTVTSRRTTGAHRRISVGLAEAFPQDTYDWRPMDGTRSVGEVLILIASEGYGFAPTALGADAAMSR